MATVPTTFTFSAGSVLTAAELNTYVSNAVAFIIAPPLFIGRQTIAQAIASSTWTAITFDTEDIDRDGGHSTVTNTSRYTSQTAGYYLSHGKGSFASNATARRWTRWDINGVEISAARLSMNAVNGDVSEPAAAGVWVYLNVGDYLELKLFQDSGGSLNTFVGNAGDQSRFNLQWMST